jgi:hypothetical protein
MSIDQLFQQAVALIGAGNVPALDRLLTDHPELAREPKTHLSMATCQGTSWT